MRSDTGNLNSQCRECKALARREYYENNREKTLEQSNKWKTENKARKQEAHKKYYAKNRDVILKKSRDSYHDNIERERARNKKYRDAHKEDRNMKRRKRHKANLEKENAQARNWYQQNKDKHLSNGKNWRRNNPDQAKAITNKYRARKHNADGEYSDRDVKRQYIIQQGLCFWCDCELNNKYHIDHIIPLSRSGNNSIGNIALCCASCNSSKGNKLPIEWKMYKKRKVA